ncbi:MAG: 4-phosphoerythronate dehydrogenase [Bacteroidales bacterium]|nr:4-phosphoerythronate dehydrogenase [Bacteroidales bacterium]
MKIIADKNIPFLEGRISGVQPVMLPAAEIDRDAVADADALMVRTRTCCDATLLHDSDVRLVATATIGTDHIDLPWCAANGIAVCNAPGCNAPGVALYVWSSLLRAGFRPEHDTLGVVGHGHVGSIVAQWGRRLGARVLVCDPPRQKAGCDDASYISLRSLLPQCDAVTLHTPLTRQGDCPTFHLINDESMALMKPGAILVNAARGEVADTRALADAIRSGRISKAIIDTWEGEPSPDPRLLALAHVATPHIAGYSVEGKQRATRMALEALHDVLGLDVDLSGLAPAYREPDIITPENITEAFDPAPLTTALKAAPADFERLRNSYPLHSELR